MKTPGRSLDTRMRAAGVMLRRGVKDPAHGGLFRRAGSSNGPGPTGSIRSSPGCSPFSAPTRWRSGTRTRHWCACTIWPAGNAAGTVASDELGRLLQEISPSAPVVAEPVGAHVHGRLHPYLAADLMIFAKLVRPVSLLDARLIADQVVRGQLAHGWRALFDRTGPDWWGPHLDGWLRAATSRPAYREVLLDILLAGAGRG